MFKMCKIFSSVFGRISIFTWMVVETPQLYENYVRKSGDSLSLGFLYTWTFGNLLNLVGAYLQKLNENMIILPLYFLLVDFALIFQVYYYRYRRRNQRNQETAPLIQPPEPVFLLESPIHIFLSLIVICLAGILSYFIYNPKECEAHEIKPIPQILGMIGALSYIISRFPQIYLNYQRQSTEGLSLAMFCFMVLANATYILAIVLDSLLINLPWLIGSAGPLILDIVLILQIRRYRRTRDPQLERN